MQTMMVDYFPRAHTAIAEWLACIVVMHPLQKRLKGWQTALLYAGFLALLLLNSQDSAPWGLIVTGDALLMLLAILLVARLTWQEAGYCWCLAFMSSEFAASLEWQINYYLIADGFFDSRWQIYLCMSAVYLVVFSVLLLITRRRNALRARMRLSGKELVSTLAITGVAFFISNFNFAFKDNIFTELLGAGVLYSRTLVDFGGLVMLYAQDEARAEINLRLELDAMENLLNRQYEQYMQYDQNNKTMHRIYHDLKHQLAFIRQRSAEGDAVSSETYLTELTGVLNRCEAEVKTGNSVLDTLLTSKNMICINSDIAMTCFADAAAMGFMDVMDVCAIFGNALDNAIECEQKIAEKDKRLIKVTVYTQNRFLLIRIENYCDSPVAFDQGFPVTTKGDKQMHGYGVRSIQHSVEKYHGHLNLEQEENWFRITALIPLPKQT